MTARVVGLGQPLAGDDGVGVSVVRSLRGRGVPPGVEVAVADEPTAALPMFLDVDLVVIVDAVVDGGPPGRVLVLDADALPARGGRLVSTHGVGIADVVGLARLLEPERVAPRLLVVGVTTRVPRLSPDALSPPVHAAVSPAVDAILDALRPPAR